MRLAKPQTKTSQKPVASAPEKKITSNKITMPGAGKKYGKATLPSQMSEPISSIGECTICIHGEKKIGKTSLCKRFPETFFFFFEPGGKGFRNCSELILSWEHFLDFIELLDRERGYAKTFVIDTIDVAYEMCFEHVCKELKIEHPTDLGFGKGWSAIKKEFVSSMDRLQKLGRGVIFLSHTDSKAFQRRSGGETHKLVATMANAAREYITGVADIIAYYGYYGDDRFLTIDGSDYVDAGNRLEENFLTTSGEKIHSVPMGNSANEAYKNLMNAFNNLQKDRGEPEEATGLSNKLAKPMTNPNKRR